MTIIDDVISCKKWTYLIINVKRQRPIQPKILKLIVVRDICNIIRFHSTSLEGRSEFLLQGRSPGLVVMGGDSYSEGCEFESRHCILDGVFFTCICCKNCNDVCLKRPKANDKEAECWPFLIIKITRRH